MNNNSFPYYEIIDSVMGKNPTISPHFTIESGPHGKDDEDDFLDDNVCATSPVQASSPRNYIQFLDDSCDESTSVSVVTEKDQPIDQIRKTGRENVTELLRYLRT